MTDSKLTIERDEKTTAPRRVVEFGEFSFDADNRILWRGAETVALAPKACELLAVLIENAPQVVSKEDLMNRVWADTFVEEANLTHHISALRKILGEDKSGRRFIETIPRKGYRFAADVREIADVTAQVTISEKITARITEEIEFDDALMTDAGESALPVKSAAASPEAEKTPERNERYRRKIYLAGAAAILIFVAVGFGSYRFFNFVSAEFRAGKLTRLTSTGKTKLAAVSPDGKFVAHVQETVEGQSLWMRQVAAEAETPIAAASQTDYRGLNFSPDGSRVYFLTGKNSFTGTLFQIPALGGQARKVLDNIYLANLGVNGIGFSPDGKQIAFIRLSPPPNDESFLMTADADGANERIIRAYKRPELIYGIPAWSPDGKIIACPFQKTEGMNIIAVNVADNSAALLLPVDLNAVSQAAWLPEGKNLIIVAEDDTETVLYQIYQVAFPGGEKRRVNHDFNNYESVNLTRDGSILAAVRTEQTAHLWTMPSGDASRLKPLTMGFEKYDGINGLGWLPDGKIVYESMPSGKQAILAIDHNGNPKQMANGGGYGAISSDGRRLVYQKSGIKDGRLNQGLFLFDTSDGNERRLTDGWDLWAEFAPDGKSVVFVRWGEDAEMATLRSVSVEGGEPSRLTKFLAITADISPDGRFIAVARWNGAKTQIAVIPFGGGDPTKTFDLDFNIQDRFGKRAIQWTPDGSAIDFIRESDGVSNIWRQPVDGGDPAQITNLTSDLIFNFAFSPDTTQLALSRGAVNRDVVLIENVR